MKKVLLMIVDALSSRVVDPAILENRLPNLRRLADASTVRAESIAIFPSITPAATSSIITGHYPRRHGIVGAYWYVPDQKTVIYYGYDIWAIFEEGVGKFIRDFLVELNQKHLKAKTLFQSVEEAGLKAACLNYLIYHGHFPHPIELPLMLKLLAAGEMPSAVDGPSLLYFGDAIHTPLPSGQTLSAPGGMFHRYGFADDTTAELLMQLKRKHGLPDFTLAYFPENDFRSHEVGPEAAVAALEEFDVKLGEIFDAFGGLSQMLEEVCVVLTGDHSQSNIVKNPAEAGINLEQLLEGFAVAAAGTPMDDSDDLVVCPNLRTAQIYFHTPTEARFQAVVDLLLQDPRIDQLMWSAALLAPDQRGFHVVTQERGHLHFWAGNDGPNVAKDEYGGEWSWEGDLRAVDATLSDDGLLTYSSYPNAFERIAGILELEVAGHLWITSCPGYEFCLNHTAIHPGGGSHGSLHLLDSLSPLWVAGAPNELELPHHLRTVDIVPLCSSILGLHHEYAPGASRANVETVGG